MKHYKPLVCCLLFWLLAVALKAQCPDFLDLNGPNVTGYFGNTYHPMANTGINPWRHALITQQGTDPHTDGQLPLLPPGESAVIKLGNDNVGGEAESLVYTFTVDPDQPIVVLKYAVVLEDPEHVSNKQPRFLIQMLDSNGDLLAPCMTYDVIASGFIPGFQSYGIIRWRPWTINAFDLSPYIGQTVKLQVSTFDCGAGGHFGYAYFTASCISNRLTINGCNGDQITLSAPSGFEGYTWNNGTTTPTAIYTVQNNTVANCVLTTVTGCQLQLFGTFSTNAPTQDQTFYDTICQGEGYNNHGFTLPPQMNSGDISAINTFFDITNCTESATNVLALHIVPRFFHIYDVACEGQDYNASGFVYQNLAVGEYTDTLDHVTGHGCDSSVILHLSVSPIVPTPLVLNGPTELCSSNEAVYSLQNYSGISSFQWSVPEGVHIVSGNGAPSAEIFFSLLSPNPSVITLTVSEGCGSRDISLPVSVYPSYQHLYSDTVCRGTDFHQHNFQLGIQDSVGLFVHIQTDTTTFGCDSIAILQLLVADTPNIMVVPDPAVLCAGSEATIHAVNANASVTLSSDLPSARLGDILCTDNSIVHPEDWPNGKTPKAIVFYVDTSGHHGWAVNLHNEMYGCTWETTIPWPNSSDVPDLINSPNPKAAISDFDGYQNTLHIRNYLDAQYHPAAYTVDFENGWYLPAGGQAYHLFAVIPFVNLSLQMVGGTPFPTDVEQHYWTSSEVNTGAVWILDTYKGLYFDDKVHSALIRSVCSF